MAQMAGLVRTPLGARFAIRERTESSKAPFSATAFLAGTVALAAVVDWKVAMVATVAMASVVPFTIPALEWGLRIAQFRQALHPAGQEVLMEPDLPTAQQAVPGRREEEISPTPPEG